MAPATILRLLLLTMPTPVSERSPSRWGLKAGCGVFRHSERRPSGCFGSVCRGHDRGLDQFLVGPDRFRSHRSGKDRKRRRHGVHRHRRPRRCPRGGQPAPVQHRYSRSCGRRRTPVGGVPSITVSEGFATAWETELGGTMIALKMNNLPEGVNLRWPHVVNFSTGSC